MAKPFPLDSQRLTYRQDESIIHEWLHITQHLCSIWNTRTLKKNAVHLWKAELFVKASPEPGDFAFLLTTANCANALVFPFWPDAQGKPFIVGTEENASFSTSLWGSCWPESLQVCWCYCKETTQSANSARGYRLLTLEVSVFKQLWAEDFNSDNIQFVSALLPLTPVPPTEGTCPCADQKEANIFSSISTAFQDTAWPSSFPQTQGGLSHSSASIYIQEGCHYLDKPQMLIILYWFSWLSGTK